MRLADVVERAVHAALENGKVAFRRVGIGVTANVFVAAVIHHFVTSKFLSDMQITASGVSKESGLEARMSLKNGAQRRAGDVRDVMRPGAAITFHKGMHDLLPKAAG